MREREREREREQFLGKVSTPLWDWLSGFIVLSNEGRKREKQEREEERWII